MTRFFPRTFVFLALALSATGCTSKRGTTPQAASGGTSGASDSSVHEESASHNASGDSRLVSQTSARSGGSNHHFKARSHEPHRAPLVASPPDLYALPRFVDNSRLCFSRDVDEDYRYRPYSNRVRGPRGVASVSGARPHRKSISKSRPAPKPTPAPAPAAPSGAMDSLGASGSGLGASQSSSGSRSLRQAERRPSPESVAPYRPREEPDDRIAPESSRPTTSNDGYGAAVYLSNDDTMSLSSAQRLIFAIDDYAPIRPQQVRPHELLNYFSFNTAPVAADHDFSVVPSVGQSPENPELWSLGFAVRGRPLTLSSRRNANLSFVVDRSGSMSSEGRMEYVKQGMMRSFNELKRGDIVNVTLFESSVCQLAQNFVVGRDSLSQLKRLIERIEPRGSTNLYDGLQAGYQAADRVYQPGYTNRVLMITDANANTGVTDERMISLVGKHYDSRRIRLSGVGVGRQFNDSLLDRLTERGKGAYVFLGSDAEVDAVFGPRFVSMIETVANDVHFKLHLPPSLKMDTFYGEEASTVKERVQAIHYFANTSQMFLSDLRSKDNSFPGSDDVMLTIEYRDPETDEPRVEEFAWNLAELQGDRRNIDKAFLVSTFARRLEQLASRPLPSRHSQRRHGWNDHEAAVNCQATRTDLADLSSTLSGDPEANRVRKLWDKYCERYQPVHVAQRSPHRGAPEGPLRHNEFAPQDTWPSAVR